MRHLGTILAIPYEMREGEGIDIDYHYHRSGECATNVQVTQFAAQSDEFCHFFRWHCNLPVADIPEQIRALAGRSCTRIALGTRSALGSFRRNAPRWSVEANKVGYAESVVSGESID